MKRRNDGGEESVNETCNEGNKTRKSCAHATYIDSLSFLKSSLATLAESIPDENFKAITEFVANHFIKKTFPNIHLYSRPPNTEEEAVSHYRSLRRERSLGFSWVDGKFNLSSKDMDDYRNWIPASLPNHIPNPLKQQISEGIALLRRKGVYPYDWMDDEEKMNATQLPPIDDFYNTLNDTTISVEDYAHAQHVWNHFGCQTFQDYHELYLKTDVLLLQDIFENFRYTCLKNYQLDPARYVSAPALAWDAMLLFSKVQLDILPEWKSDIYMLYEKGIRGGVTMVSKRYAAKEENTCLHYVDANNLYGWAMSQPLPTGDHYSVSDTEIQELNIDGLLSRPMDEDEYGYTFVVDLRYPMYLHDAHNDLPLLPEKRKTERSMISDYQYKMYQETYGEERRFTSIAKLTPTLYDKTYYTLHERSLKQCLDLGLELKKIHKVIRFKQSTWMKGYIEHNTRMRTNATTDYEKDFFKLMNNSVFGKTMENVRNHRKHRVCTDGDYARKYIRLPSFYSAVFVDEDILIVQQNKEIVELSKPIYVGCTILDLSKTLMYDYHYNFARKYLRKRTDLPILCYMDTDSFIYHIPMSCQDRDAIIKEHQHLFDCSNYPRDHPLYSAENKKVIGKMKNEVPQGEIEELVALRPKSYAFRTSNNVVVKKSKGVKRNVLERDISFNDFKDCFMNHIPLTQTMRGIQSFNHHIYSMEKSKLSLSAYDDKRFISEDGVHTKAHGHYIINRFI